MKQIFILFYLIFMSFISLNSNNWVNPSELPTSYVFAPGTFTAESQMSKYLPIFSGSTGELIKCQNGIEVINSSASACNFADVVLKRHIKKVKNAIMFLKKYKKQIMHFFTIYFNRFLGIEITNNNQSNSLTGISINFQKVNFGQELDIQYFKNTYDNHLQRYHHNQNSFNIVLYGCSRGAATIFNFFSVYKPKNIKALICEGMFDSIPLMLQNRFSVIGRLMLKSLEFLTKFKKDGLSPFSSIDQIPHDIPILLIASLKDKIVPFNCSINLYKKLKDSGHKKVHILILNHSGHNWYALNKEDKNLYQCVVHAFYKNYGLPYVEKYASAGKDYFSQKTQL